MTLRKAATSLALQMVIPMVLGISASVCAQAQNHTPVELTRYDSFVDGDYGVEVTLMPKGKVIFHQWGYTDLGVREGITLHGVWMQHGDLLTMKFKTAQGPKTMVYQIKAQNDEPTLNCKGPYGLSPVSEQGNGLIAGHRHLWPYHLIEDKDPCVD